MDKEFDNNDKLGNYIGVSIFPPLALTKNDKEDELAGLLGHLYAIKEKSDRLSRISPCSVL